YEMFLGPIEQSKPWDTKGIDGVQKFLRKYWSLFMSEQGFYISDEQPQKEALKVLHQTIKKVTDDIERFSFNTCVSAFMMCVNELKRMEVRSRHILEPLNILLAPFAPFITEEIWALCGHASSVHAETYPTFDPTAVEEDAIEYPICVNGKKRDVLEIPKTFSQQEIQEMALNSPKVMKYLEGKDLQKVIVVPNRMINFVVKE
ncbi:MAG: class I tRNA ligase family protein, partial [Saprospiraceae bacterium]|nr:class I tRNA ligase family protein [Saprospiraceae bacterium]